MKKYHVYILASQYHGSLYIGVTSNLTKRIWQHKNKEIKGFTAKYEINKLVYIEEFADIILAIRREKRLKMWRREWKVNLIEKSNPYWVDLYFEVV